MYAVIHQEHDDLVPMLRIGMLAGWWIMGILMWFKPSRKPLMWKDLGFGWT
jgi:hypothetical protein